MMNMRTAILKSADSIDEFPHLFDFGSIMSPDAGCGTPACAIGWISHHMGAEIDPEEYTQLNGLKGFTFTKWFGIMKCTESEFYKRMDKLEGHKYLWKNDNRLCAEILRKYADKFHPAVNAIPQVTLDIFKPEALAA